MPSTPPLWSRSSFSPPSALKADLHTQVAVIGGGITGLTAALLLAEAGKRVTLFETRRLAAGVSGATTAHLTEALDTRYHQLESKFGREGAALARASTREAIEKIGALASALEIDSGFARLDGYLFATDDKQLGELDLEFPAAERAGAAVRRVTEVPLPIETRGAAVFGNQAQLDPTQYLAGLSQRLVRAGGEIYEGVLVSHVENEGQFRLETDVGPTVTADAVVVATHAPFQTTKLEVQLAQYRSYVVSAPIAAPLGGLFWDLADPYHYYRSATVGGQEHLIVGGGDHRTGTLPKEGPDAPFHELEELVRRFGVASRERWSSQVVESADGLPFIGKPDPKAELYLAQGYSGNGITFGTLAALIISDTLLGRANRYAELYRATRFKPIAAAGAVLSENAQTAAHLVAGHVKPVSDQPLEDLPAGQGCIIKSNGHKLAVYRDDQGSLHAVSAICTHQGCEVAFNPVERSWDCPCHGSRFDVDGKLLDGPAEKPLPVHTI